MLGNALLFCVLAVTGLSLKFLPVRCAPALFNKLRRGGRFDGMKIVSAKDAGNDGAVAYSNSSVPNVEVVDGSASLPPPMLGVVAGEAEAVSSTNGAIGHANNATASTNDLLAALECETIARK